MPNFKFLKSPEKAFLFIAITFGCLYLLITPPFQVADEYQHYFRSYQVSELTLISQKKVTDCYGRQIFKPATICVGGSLPISILLTAQNASTEDLRFNPEKKQNIEDIISVLKYKFNPKNRLFVPFPNSALYTPIPYIPQAIGIATGRLFKLPGLILLYLGRLSNLLTWITLMYFAIKIIPFYKWLIFLLALTPMSLFQAASLSADAFTNGISYLFIATILHLTFAEIQFLQTRQLIAIGILSLLLGLSKSAYFSLLFLYLLIPLSKLETTKKYWTTFGLLLLTTLTSITGWSILVKIALYVPLNPGTKVSPNQQLTYILNHPLEFASILLNSIIKYGKYGIEQFLGRLGWLDTPLPPLLIISYTTLLLLIASSSYHPKISLSFQQKTIIFLLATFNSLLISIAMYLTWTPVGEKIIEGVQGRYFIPIAPLFFLLLYNQKIKMPVKLPPSLMAVFSLFSCTLTAFVLFQRYW